MIWRYYLNEVSEGCKEWQRRMQQFEEFKKSKPPKPQLHELPTAIAYPQRRADNAVNPIMIEDA